MLDPCAWRKAVTDPIPTRGRMGWVGPGTPEKPRFANTLGFPWLCLALLGFYWLFRCLHLGFCWLSAGANLGFSWLYLGLPRLMARSARPRPSRTPPPPLPRRSPRRRRMIPMHMSKEREPRRKEERAAVPALNRGAPPLSTNREHCQTKNRTRITRPRPRHPSELATLPPGRPRNGSPSARGSARPVCGAVDRSFRHRVA